MAIVAIIPARYGSTRLPGKPLSDIHGKPMIQHVHDRVRLAGIVDRVLVATDDQRIAEAVRGFGGEVVMTSPHHPTGSDRVAEAACSCGAEIVVNVQGDEPMLDPGSVEAAVEALLADAAVPMSTLSAPLRDADEMLDPSVVKVVVDARGDALYFSRCPIPHFRWGDVASLPPELRLLARKHVGLYAYRYRTLQRLAALPQTPLERAEGLEQLRALYHGIRIRVVPRAAAAAVAVDTPEDLERVRALLRPPTVTTPEEDACPPSTSS